MGKRIVGLDIGRDVLRAVEVEGAGTDRPRITRIAQATLPEGAVRAGEVREVHTVASALKRLWATSGFKTKQVVIGMGNQRVLARDLTIPYMSAKQIRESLPFQVQDLLPVPVEEAVLDFYAISEGQGENGRVLNGLLVAAVKEAVNGNMAAVKEAGLTAVEVDLIPFALTRMASAAHRSGNVALVDIGATTTNLVITVGGVPVFVRIIPAGGDDVTRAVREKFDVTPDQAEQAKRLLGVNLQLATPEQRPVAEVIYTAAGELITSIRNTLTYFLAANPNLPVGQIVLSGGGAQLPGLANALGELTRITVVPARPFDGVEVARSAAGAGQQTDVAVALGLALGSAA